MLVFLDVNRRERVVLNNLFADKNCVLVVVAFPAHKADENVSSKRKLCVLRAGTVGNYLTGDHFVTLGNCRLLIDASTLVGSDELL